MGHVPRGFVEAGLTKFFSQFGSVKKVKLARSKKASFLTSGIHEMIEKEIFSALRTCLVASSLV